MCACVCVCIQAYICIIFNKAINEIKYIIYIIPQVYMNLVISDTDSIILDTILKHKK